MSANSTTRELLAAMAFVALAIAGIVSGPPMTWVALSAFIYLFLTKLIDSLVQTGMRKYTSVAFSVVAGLYLLLCVYLGESEFHPYNSKPANLPTTDLIRTYLYPTYIPGQSDRAVYLARAENAKSALPLGHLTIACVIGYLGVWYVRLTRKMPAHVTE